MDIAFAYPRDTMPTMDILKSWLTAEYGRAGRLARHLKVPASFVSAMGDGRKPVPFHHGAEIEAFTERQVTRQQMFPNDWRRIWPELAAAERSAESSPPHNHPHSVSEEV